MLCNMEARGPAEKIVQNGVVASLASLAATFYASQKSHRLARSAAPPFPTNNFVVCGEWWRQTRKRLVASVGVMRAAYPPE